MTSSTNRSDIKKIFDLLMFNPFHYFAGLKAMITGVIIILITGYLGHFSDICFDGLILYCSKGPLYPVMRCLLDGLIPWLIISLLLLITGKIISKSKFRIVDVMGTQALARFPYLLLALLPMMPGMTTGIVNYNRILYFSESLTDLISVALIPYVVFYGISTFMTAWMIILMYKAFSVSCNVSGRKAVFGFGICIIIGYIISPLAINHIPYTPDNQTQVSVQKTDLESKVHEMITLCTEDKFDEVLAMYDDNMRSSYSAEIIKSGWIDVQSKFGSYKNHGQVLISEQGNYPVCDVICYFEKGWMHYRWVFNNDGQISRFIYF